MFHPLFNLFSFIMNRIPAGCLPPSAVLYRNYVSIITHSLSFYMDKCMKLQKISQQKPPSAVANRRRGLERFCVNYYLLISGLRLLLTEPRREDGLVDREDDE